jgi:hypothetical protein
MDRTEIAVRSADYFSKIDVRQIGTRVLSREKPVLAGCTARPYTRTPVQALRTAVLVLRIGVLTPGTAVLAHFSRRIAAFPEVLRALPAVIQRDLAGIPRRTRVH